MHTRFSSHIKGSIAAMDRVSIVLDSPLSCKQLMASYSLCALNGLGKTKSPHLDGQNQVHFSAYKVNLKICEGGCGRHRSAERVVKRDH